MTRDVYWRHIYPLAEVDGDTSTYIEDDGRRQYAVRRDRDLGINTPEMHDKDPDVRAKAVAAKIVRRGWFTEHRECNTAYDFWPRVDGTLFPGFTAIFYFLLRSSKSDSFDRWLSDIECQAGHSLNQYLLDQGYAVPFTG